LPKRSPRAAKTVSEAPADARARFFDASAIAKAYVRETETAHVRRWLADGAVIVSRLSEIEVPSAIYRRCREGMIARRAGDTAVRAFLADVDRWAVVELTSGVSRRAIVLREAHALRAGDAIQLASALEARARLGPDLSRFVAYNARLLAAARAEGLAIEEY